MQEERQVGGMPRSCWCSRGHDAGHQTPENPVTQGVSNPPSHWTLSGLQVPDPVHVLLGTEGRKPTEHLHVTVAPGL